ncbi:MAG: hypothetical protein Homavirus15_6 [Homavirus sp.]|uniref:Uncharacterized protein n=1 Tax=Homavirus sp. TaxID=2487769 RepID=A0A3G5A4R2_9VIRU|nr:MAG: hypothetical protein Homavirus15_6 [Homavirus sp.]
MNLDQPPTSTIDQKTIRGRRKIKKLGFIIESNTNKKDIDQLLYTIEKKFSDKLKNYIYLSDINLLRKGKYIYYISLHLSEIHSGIVVDISKNLDGIVYLLTLKNPYANILWKIKVNKYHIFVLDKRKKSSYVMKCLSSYLNSIDMSIDDIIK